MKYFTHSPYTENSLKCEYRFLCKKLHPDTGGDAEKFKEMMNEYVTVRLLIGKTNCRTEYSSFKSNLHDREDSGFSKKSKSSEELRYSILYNSLARYRCIDEALKTFLRKISVLPFKDAAIAYNKFTEEIKITMEFGKVIDELEILKFSGYNEISYTIEYEQGSMFKSCATIDTIIEKIINIIKQ